MNRIRSWLCALACCALAACGGGGGDDGPDPLPTAVTATVSAAGGDIDVALAEGASATLEFPAGAFAADREVTVTPLAGQSGEWTRFTVEPGLSALGAPLKLRVRPPAAITAAAVPVLQLVTAEGLELLVTKRLADGTLEATLAPQLATLLSAPPGRRQALAARPLADGADAAVVVGTGFLALCQAPDSVLADAMRVINNASSASAVRTALSTLTLVADRCVQPGVLDEAGLLRVNQALQDLARRLPAIYADAMAAWRGIDFNEVEAQLEPFKRGVRRLFALCAAAGEIGAEFVCPLSTDFEPEYAELTDGFAAAANARENQASLRLLFDQLLPLVPEVALAGFNEAEQAMRETLALIADRLMDRAYALCSHGDLAEWRVYVERGGYSNRSSRTLAKAIAHCGVRGEVTPATSDDADGWVRGTAQAIEPGTLEGEGRTAARTVEARFDSGRVIVALHGPTLRCSRVIGTPEARDEQIELRVGATVLGIIDLVRSTDGDTTSLREAALDMPSVLAQIGREADSTDPVVIEAWRKAAGPLDCVDSRGGTLALLSEEEKLFALDVRPLRVEEPRVDGTYRGTMTWINMGAFPSTVTVRQSVGGEVISTIGLLESAELGFALGADGTLTFLGVAAGGVERDANAVPTSWEPHFWRIEGSLWGNALNLEGYFPEGDGWRLDRRWELSRD